MRAAHAGLGITPAQFAAVTGHLSAALAAGGAPAPLIDRMIGHVARREEDVVWQWGCTGWSQCWAYPFGQ